MRRIGIKLTNCILTFALTAGMTMSVQMPVYATTIAEIEKNIDHTQGIIDGLEGEIDSLTGEQDILLEQMDDLNAEVINMMAGISMLEDEIAGKEQEIAIKEQEIAIKQQEYEQAKKAQEEQETAMAAHIQVMYEFGATGNTSWLGLLLKSTSFADLLNRISYAEQVMQYDADRLTEYEEAKNRVHDLWDQLEAEKADLEAQKVDLEAQKKNLEDQKAYCDGLVAELKRKSADYDAKIARIEKEAKAAKQILKEEKAQLAKLQEEERRKQALANAMNQTYETTAYTEIIDAASGSDLGKKVAKYGCQYIGNKYVYGGTSLTSGTDCSGFTYRVYQNFGYNLPRTSYEQRSAGTAVEYKNAQPGDLICYSGHVGIYIGGGYIVHASNSKPYPQGGIKVSKANYRTILSVRRIIQ